MADSDSAYNVFPWCPDRTSRMELEVPMEVVQLGGDYELRAGKGIQGTRRRLVMEFDKRTDKEAAEIEHFFRGVKHTAFPIQDPRSGEFFQARIDGTLQTAPSGPNSHLNTVRVGVVEVFEP